MRQLEHAQAAERMRLAVQVVENGVRHSLDELLQPPVLRLLVLAVVLSLDELLHLDFLILALLDFLLLLKLLLSLLLGVQLRSASQARGDAALGDDRPREVDLLVGNESPVCFEVVLQDNRKRRGIGHFRREVKPHVFVEDPQGLGRRRQLRHDLVLQFRAVAEGIGRLRHLPECVGPVDRHETLLAEHVVLDVLVLDRVEDQPGGDSLQHMHVGFWSCGILTLVRLVAVRVLLAGKGRLKDRAAAVFARPHGLLDQLEHFGDDQDLDALALPDAAHPERPLHVVAEHHVLAEREERGRVDLVLDVHARGVDLIVEREAPLERDATLISRDDAARGADDDLLAILIVQEDDAVTPL
mmetsp:Transcript_13338/g.49550  ORF Transcript_13338/g.49550 Transcript_13338/m.49550 type:complete len:356 (+) Transcript_13338:2678-3745(+)